MENIKRVIFRVIDQKLHYVTQRVFLAVIWVLTEHITVKNSRLQAGLEPVGAEVRI